MRKWTRDELYLGCHLHAEPLLRCNAEVFKTPKYSATSAMRYAIFALSAYLVGSLIYEMWLPCMVVAIMSVLKLIYITVYDYAQRNNKIVGKELKDFSDKELFNEILERKNDAFGNKRF